MPKRTTKYVKALEVAERLQIGNVSDQERLYRLLAEHSFFWDAESKLWQQVNEPADPPSQLVRVRIWTDSSKVTEAASRIKTVFEDSGYQMIEQSEPYVCRPSKQLESRVYLIFQQKA